MRCALEVGDKGAADVARDRLVDLGRVEAADVVGLEDVRVHDVHVCHASVPGAAMPDRPRAIRRRGSPLEPAEVRDGDLSPSTTPALDRRVAADVAVRARIERPPRWRSRPTRRVRPDHRRRRPSRLPRPGTGGRSPRTGRSRAPAFTTVPSSTKHGASMWRPASMRASGDIDEARRPHREGRRREPAVHDVAMHLPVLLGRADVDPVTARRRRRRTSRRRSTSDGK